MTVFAGNRIFASDINAIINATTAKPMVRLVQQSAQSLSSDTDTAITFGASSEDWDTHGFHDTSTNTSRITPTVAGYYRLTGAVWLAADTDVISYYSMIGKNGSVVGPRIRTSLPSTATASTTRSIQVVAVQTANGSSDYFELFGRQLQAAAAALNTNAAASAASVFECEYLRPL
jgi:hypothetical protein